MNCPPQLSGQGADDRVVDVARVSEGIPKPTSLPAGRDAVEELFLCRIEANVLL
jgi:hypothetical protein